MKKKTLLQGLCYVLIPIMVAILVLSIIYVGYQKDNIMNNEEDNNIDYFTNIYMNKLVRESRTLIFENSNYNKIQDNGKTIVYDSDSNVNTVSTNIEDYYFLIQYKELAFTNVELTTDTNTIQKITEYIKNQDGKKTSIVNGNVVSDTENISKKAIKYFSNFDMRYFKDDSDNASAVINIRVESDKDIANSTQTWYETNISDFNIYTTYHEVLVQNGMNSKIEKMVYKLAVCEPFMYIMIPISSIIIVLASIYLIISICKTEDNKKIHLNTFDKTPLELLGVVGIFIVIAFVAVISELSNNDNLSLLISLIITAYILCYITWAAIVTSIIKRLKAKRFWKTTMLGGIIVWLHVVLKKMNMKFKQISTRRQRLIYNVFIILFVETTLLLISVPVGFIIDCVINIIVIIQMTKYINSYEKIEKKLKDIYSGKNKYKLREEDVNPEFINTVKYVNDISNGFDNAVSESLKSERLKTELITNVSHDIKTPLTSIINYVDLLKQENIRNKKANEYIEVLDSKSQRLKKLIEDLVEASKASSGAIKLNMEDMNIVELLKQSLGEFEDKFETKGLKAILEVSSNNLKINADSRYIYRVIENIFSNISKYALENSRVYVDITEIDNKVILDIKNISKDKLNISEDELMQRFVRGDKSRTTEGSGLGLSIAKSLTELQKGEFSIKIDGDLFKVHIVFNKIK